MKKLAIYIFLAYIALALQAVFFHGMKPDLALVLVYFYAVKYGQTKGVIYGALTGLLIDTASGFIIGPNIISKSLAAFFANAIKENLFQWNIIISTLLMAIISLFDILLVYICLETFSKVSFVNRPWSISVIEIVYTVLTAMIIYPLYKAERNRRLADVL